MNVPLSTRHITRRGFLRACAVGATTFGCFASLAKASLRTQTASKSPGPSPSLHPRWTFESFVAGAANFSAYTACLAASEAWPMCNPLFIHGAVGLGKTHLLHAIGHQIRARRPDEGVLYTTSEQFARESSTLVDVLLIDDIQFLAGNRSAQREALNTFHALFARHKQIVITSDCPLEEIADLHPRFGHCLAGGSKVELSPPNIETAKSILRKKSESLDFEAGDELIDFLAQRFHRNVRRLEGALMRVASHALHHGGAIPDSDEINRMLRDLLMLQGAVLA